MASGIPDILDFIFDEIDSASDVELLCEDECCYYYRKGMFVAYSQVVKWGSQEEH